MNDTLDIIVERMNSFGKSLSKKSSIYLKKVIFKSEEYADKGIQQIENEKLKWKLKKTYIQLGKYIHNSNKDRDVFDYSSDDTFILLLDKINRIKKMINDNQRKKIDVKR